VRTQKSCSDFFRQSQPLVLVVQLDKEKRTDILQSGQLKKSSHYFLSCESLGSSNKGAASASSIQPEQTTNLVHLSIIDSLEAAKVHYSAKSLFVANLTRERGLSV
jgi:hypothetical protein